MRRYVVSLPPATLSIPRAADGVDGLAPGAHAFARARRAGRGGPRYVARTRLGVEHLRPERDRRLVEDLSHVRRLDGDGAGVGLVLRVRRPEQEHPVPRHREGDAHVVLRDRERRRPSLPARHQDVHALAQPHRRAGAGILEATHVVDPRPGRVDDRRRLDRDRLPVDAHLRPGDAAGGRSQLDHLGAVEHDCARVGRRADVRQAEARVVRPRVRVERAGAQPGDAEVGDHAARAGRVDEPVQPRPRERRVQEDAALHERGPKGPTFVEREQERDAVHEMGRDDLRQRAPLVVRLPHEADIAQAQVAKAAVDQLRGRARRRASEVARVDERDGEAGARRVRGDRGADDAAADDEQVEAAPGELLQSAAARYLGPDVSGRYTAIGFAHAFLPAASVTSTRT